MLKYLAMVLLLFVPVPAAAGSITWAASGTWTFVSDPQGYWPGLQVGTPWSLALTFDPTMSGQQIGGPSNPHCYSYATGAAALTIGGFSYSNSSGNVFTNFQFPDVGCTESVLPSEPGLVTFLFLGPWSQQPGAWNLNGLASAFSVSYYDLLAVNGTLPTAPTINPNLSAYDGIKLDLTTGSRNSQLFSEFAPSAVPEPGTMAMLGIGLASLFFRRMRT